MRKLARCQVQMLCEQSEGLCSSGEGLQLFNVIFMTWMLGQGALLANSQVIWNWARVVYSALNRDNWRRIIVLFSATFWNIIEKTKKSCAGIGQTKHHQVGTLDYIKKKPNIYCKGG